MTSDKEIVFTSYVITFTSLKGFFQFYTDIFILYMISRFARDAHKGEVSDKLLGKSVPSVIAIQNQHLLMTALKEELTLNKENRKLLKLQAESNEVFHNLMKECGLAARIDADIGLEFINLRLTTEH